MTKAADSNEGKKAAPVKDKPDKIYHQKPDPLGVHSVMVFMPEGPGPVDRPVGGGRHDKRDGPGGVKPDEPAQRVHGDGVNTEPHGADHPEADEILTDIKPRRDCDEQPVGRKQPDQEGIMRHGLVR